MTNLAAPPDRPAAGRSTIAMGGAALPMGCRHDPLDGVALPLDGQPDPMNGAAPPTSGRPDPLGGVALPLDGQPDPMNGAAPPTSGRPDPLGGAARPMDGQPDPMDGAAPPTSGRPDPLRPGKVDHWAAARPDRDAPDGYRDGPRSAIPPARHPVRVRDRSMTRPDQAGLPPRHRAGGPGRFAAPLPTSHRAPRRGIAPACHCHRSTPRVEVRYGTSHRAAPPSGLAPVRFAQGRGARLGVPRRNVDRAAVEPDQ